MRIRGVSRWGVGLALFGVLASAQAQDRPELLAIVATQSVYADVARAIAGDRANVEAILAAPDQDPHLFEPTPAVARLLADADIVLVNGAEYDHWAEDLLAASRRDDRTVIEAAGLVGAAEGDNPHLWYAPATVPAVARELTAELTARDPEGAAGYEARLAGYLAGLQPLEAKIGAIRSAYQGVTVAATEPVFGPMAEALGLSVAGEDFQRAIMNETEPSARDIAAIEDDIRNRRVRVLIFNRQVGEALPERLVAIAREAGVPVVGVSETLPEGIGYADWMLQQLEALEEALAGPPA